MSEKLEQLQRDMDRDRAEFADLRKEFSKLGSERAAAGIKDLEIQPSPTGVPESIVDQGP